jgi:hypothetical protein
MVSAASQGLTNTNPSTVGLFLDQKLQQAVGLKENPALKAYMSSNQPNSQNVSFIHQTGTSMNNNNNTSVVYG